MNYIANIYQSVHVSDDMIKVIANLHDSLMSLALKYVKKDLETLADTIQPFSLTNILVMPVTIELELKWGLTDHLMMQEATVARAKALFSGSKYFYYIYGLSESFGLIGRFMDVFIERPRSSPYI